MEKFMQIGADWGYTALQSADEQVTTAFVGDIETWYLRTTKTK